MKRAFPPFCLALVACVAGPVFADPFSFSFQTVINPTDPNFTQLLGINNTSTIAGYFGDGVVVPNNGFTLVLPNTFTAENFPASQQTQVVGINNSGETVGFYITGGVTHGFKDVLGVPSTVDFPNPTSVLTQLLGVNDSGEAAGYWQNAGGAQFPFTVLGTTFTPLDPSLPANTMAQATDANNAGEVSGFFVDGTGTHGFLLNGTTETTLNFPGSNFTQALGLNNMGEVVGDYVDGAGNMHGFIYNGTFQEVDDPTVPTTGTTINGINDKGQIVGFFVTGVTTPDGVPVTDGFVGTPVPEPGSLMLLGTALAGVALTLRKRRAH